jgi:hypothetical protein
MVAWVLEAIFNEIRRGNLSPPGGKKRTSSSAPQRTRSRADLSRSVAHRARGARRAVRHRAGHRHQCVKDFSLRFVRTTGKPKDWYDIAFVLLHNDEGGVNAAANRVLAIFGSELVCPIRTALDDLATTLATPNLKAERIHRPNDPRPPRTRLHDPARRCNDCRCQFHSQLLHG